MQLPIIAGVVLASLLTGCGGKVAKERTVVDSAGITIVTMPAPDSTIDRWYADSVAPLFILGGDADALGTFASVSGVARFTDGRLVVSTDTDVPLRLIDSLGNSLGAFGRRGEGPGEFRRAPRVFAFVDSLVTVQDARGVVTVGMWNSRMEFVREYRVALRGAYSSWDGPLGLGSDGRVVFMRSLIKTGEKGAHRASVILDAVAPSGGEALAVLRIPGDDRFGLEGARDAYVAFGKVTVATISGGRLYTSTNDGAEVDEWSTDGQLRAIWRMALPLERVTGRDRERHVQEAIEDAPADNRELTAAVMQDVQYAETLRHFDALYPAEGNGVWIARARLSDRMAREYLVVDSLGRMTATISLPPERTPLWIGTDRVFLRWRDKDGVGYLGMYRLGPKR